MASPSPSTATNPRWLTSSFWEYLKGDVVGMANPFSIRDLEGDHQWGIDGDTNRLKLIFKLGSGVFTEQIDGSLYLKVKTGFKVLITLKSSDMWAFGSLAKSFEEQGFIMNTGFPQNDRITQWTTGLGGDSVMMFGMMGGDYLSISDDGGIVLSLVRYDEGDETGDEAFPERSWRATDDLSSTADIVVQLDGVIRYTEVTGDWEGSGAEESELVVPNPDDILGIDDTPISPTYHPMRDRTLGTDPIGTQPSAMIGAVMLMAMIAGIGTLIQVKA